MVFFDQRMAEISDGGYTHRWSIEPHPSSHFFTFFCLEKTSFTFFSFYLTINLHHACLLLHFFPPNFMFLFNRFQIELRNPKTVNRDGERIQLTCCNLVFKKKLGQIYQTHALPKPVFGAVASLPFP